MGDAWSNSRDALSECRGWVKSQRACIQLRLCQVSLTMYTLVDTDWLYSNAPIRLPYLHAFSTCMFLPVGLM
jgi:hypothetical protein